MKQTFQKTVNLLTCLFITTLFIQSLFTVQGQEGQIELDASQEAMIQEAYLKTLEEVYDESIKSLISSNYPASFNYALYDIDENGIPELIIAENDSARQIYTYDLEEATVVLLEEVETPFTERSQLLVTKDSLIHQQLSGGAPLTKYDTYRIAEDGISLEQVGDYLFDADSHPSAPFVIDGDTSTTYTEDEFDQLVEGQWYNGSSSDPAEIEFIEIDNLFTDNPFHLDEN